MNNQEISHDVLQLLTSGQALFETILYENGILWFWEDHLERLNGSLRQFGVYLDADKIKERVLLAIENRYVHDGIRVKIVAACSFTFKGELYELDEDHILILLSDISNFKKHYINYNCIYLFSNSSSFPYRY